ncbi:hypothetical protein KVR01_007322 [Diaporthe batatas]|uniref:uncharacterized protein n=1 Tax=Diaporthe batatas TaxID=748121 RepID=UPI001D039D77|nr:uncharacterized protein KVR01_007322 [Diaporthe batatas]KAG8162844.1 hypothetical protein KVR01_007322 [Diaporthe batatas]
MPFKLFHGESVDDSARWCPVCFYLDYQNLKTFFGADKKLENTKADPEYVAKGTLTGYHLWWRGRPDFQQRAEQNACVFCAVLLQIVDRFWKRQESGRPIDKFLIYGLNVFTDGSVELFSMRDLPRRPLRLLLYKPPGHPPPWGRLPAAPHISPSGNSKQALQFLRRQLEICSQEHEECRHDFPVLPTRVLDVGTLETELKIKLVEPSSGTIGRYIALSYCWGDGSSLQATKSNLSELLQGVDEEELPATIRDAVELARQIRVQYLWVDALCIIQDDLQDWIHESARMSAVYAQAHLTISASSVASSRLSFLHQSRGNKEVLFHWQSHVSDTRINGTDHAVDTSLVRSGMLAVRRTTSSGFHQDLYDNIIDPAMTRAWTLQEHALATRLVCFSTDEIQWTCRTLRACECQNPEENESSRLEQLQRRLSLTGREGNVAAVRADNMSQEALQFWIKLIEAYCRRDLSCVRDKLPALSGVAQEFLKTSIKEQLAEKMMVPPLRYLAGLWSFDIQKMLLWYPHPQGGSFVEYRAPSWSWASIDGSIRNAPIYWVLRPRAEVLAAACTPANSDDPFGQVVREGTYLRLRATLVETQMWFSPQSQGREAEVTTPYGWVIVDGDLEEVPINEAVWGKSSAATATTADDDIAVTPDPSRTRTLQRRPQKLQQNLHLAERREVNRVLSRYEGGSEEEFDSASHGRQRFIGKGSKPGTKFTVWLLHVADDDLHLMIHSAHLLVLGRPAGDEEVYERLGYLNFYRMDKWAVEFAGQAKSIVTIV